MRCCVEVVRVGGVGVGGTENPRSLSRLEPHSLCIDLGRNDCIIWFPVEGVHRTFGRCPALEKNLAGPLGCLPGGGVTNGCWPFRRDVRVPEVRAFALFSG